MSLVDLGYRRAKAAKAVKRALDSGKIVHKAGKKSKRLPERTQSRTEEMRELFQSDMTEKKRTKSSGGTRSKKSKNSFKSKSRYAVKLSPTLLPSQLSVRFQGILCCLVKNKLKNQV